MDEKDLFRIIQDGRNAISNEVDNLESERAANLLIEMNNALEKIIDHYNESHDSTSPTMTINLDNCLLIRNLLLLDVIWVIGPTLFSDTSMIDWNQFSSNLKISETCLKKGFQLIPQHFSSSEIDHIVISALKSGFIEDFEVSGAVYSIFYFIHFILRAEKFNLPFSTSVNFFYSHLSSFSFVLLVTCILSIQQTSARRAKWLNYSISRLMGVITMLPGGVSGVISTLLSFSEGGNMDAIVHAAKGIASCSRDLDRPTYMSNICRQIASLLGDKSSNKFVVTTCVHIIDILIQKHEIAVFSVFFTTLFGPLLSVTQQPFYGTLSFDISQSNWDATSIETAVRGLVRIMITGSTLLSIMDACACLIPAVFHAFVFAEASRNVLKSLLGKLLNTFISNSSIAVYTFLRLAQGKGIAKKAVRFALDENGGLILRSCELGSDGGDDDALFASSNEDRLWILDLDQRSSWTRETAAIIALWPKNQISGLFVELLDLYFRSHSGTMIERFSDAEKERIATVLLGIINTNNSDLFGDDLLQGLQSMERVLTIALDPENNLDNVSEVLTICHDLFSFIATSSMKLPLVMEFEKKSKKDDDEVLYKRELEAVVSRMLTIVSKQSSSDVLFSLQTSLQTILSRVKKETFQPSTNSPSTETLSESTSDILRHVMTDLRSPYQPIRSFALSRLRRLIETTKPEELDNEIPEVLTLLKKGLNDEDSYVYLSAVNALVILASSFHQRVLPVLLELFGNAMAPLDLRLRVGEAIVQTVHFMKDASIKFAPALFQAFFTYMEPANQLTWKQVEVKKQDQATAEDEVFAIQALRASCFSALAELATYLRYTVEPHVPEILSHCRGVLLFEKTEEAVLVRRAAVFLLYRLVLGAGDDLQGILDKQVNEVDHILQQATMDRDDIVKGHAEASLKLLHHLRYALIEECCCVCNKHE